MTELITTKIGTTYNYDTYKALVLKQAEESATSGEQTKEHIEATAINAQRIKRIDKQCELIPALLEELKKITQKMQWVLITESWCGDGAQCIPVIAKIAQASPYITLKLIFRDENPEFMDGFLTNGSRSIPKLVCMNGEENEIIGTWGPRPSAIQAMVVEYKKNNPGVTHEEFVKNLHLWYARDKTKALQDDFVSLLKEWKIAK